MISKSLAVMGVLMLLSATSNAGSAPKEFYGKSITLQWSESWTAKFGSEQRARNGGTATQMNVYVSTAGRPFLRVMSTGMGGRSNQEAGGSGARRSTNLTETAPEEAAAAKQRVEFEGRSIVVYRQFLSGAHRIAIDTDGTTCKATVINGKEAGANNVRYSGGYGRYEILSVQVGSVSCSIREGNVFGQ
jgi:hypothetical protein